MVVPAGAVPVDAEAPPVFADTAPLDLVYVAHHARMSLVPAAQRDAYAWLAAGAMAQNVYLFCASAGLATVIRAWFDRDALAAQVGGIGIAPGANLSDTVACFEATHGTAPKHAGLDRINPGSVILSGVMMLEFMGWQEAANLITAGLSAAIANAEVTYDLARLLEPPVEPLSCSGFAEAVVRHFRA